MIVMIFIVNITYQYIFNIPTMPDSSKIMSACVVRHLMNHSVYEMHTFFWVHLRLRRE